EARLDQFAQDEALIVRRHFERIPDGAHHPEDEPRDDRLEKHLGCHADIVDDRLSAAGPGAERVVAKDAHRASPASTWTGRTDLGCPRYRSGRKPIVQGMVGSCGDA